MHMICLSYQYVLVVIRMIYDTSNSGPILSFIACDARDRIEDTVYPLSVVSAWKHNLYKDQDAQKRSFDST